MSDPIRIVQTMLQNAGFDPGPIDGQWGNRTYMALSNALNTKTVNELAWGNKVSSHFRNKVIEICRRQQMNPSYLMACMAFESGETFSPAVCNAAGSGAVGLIQFMPRTAEGLGTSCERLREMSAETQLDFVERYFMPYRGRLRSLADHYMAILWPAAIGRSAEAMLWDQMERPTTYRQNSGLDGNQDRIITVGEAAAKVQAKLEKGLTAPFVWSNDASPRMTSEIVPPLTV